MTIPENYTPIVTAARTDALPDRMFLDVSCKLAEAM